jgi:hypothetical protein
MSSGFAAWNLWLGSISHVHELLTHPYLCFTGCFPTMISRLWGADGGIIGLKAIKNG